jgi:hypothetical protein
LGVVGVFIKIPQDETPLVEDQVVSTLGSIVRSFSMENDAWIVMKMGRGIFCFDVIYGLIVRMDQVIYLSLFRFSI